MDDERMDDGCIEVWMMDGWYSWIERWMASEDWVEARRSGIESCKFEGVSQVGDYFANTW